MKIAMALVVAVALPMAACSHRSSAPPLPPACSVGTANEVSAAFGKSMRGHEPTEQAVTTPGRTMCTFTPAIPIPITHEALTVELDNGLRARQFFEAMRDQGAVGVGDLKPRTTVVPGVHGSVVIIGTDVRFEVGALVVLLHSQPSVDPALKLAPIAARRLRSRG